MNSGIDIGVDESDDHVWQGTSVGCDEVMVGDEVMLAENCPYICWDRHLNCHQMNKCVFG
jgi:hypothetical protein